MQQVHSDVLKIFQSTYPTLNIGNVISYDDANGMLLDTSGNKLEYQFAKYSPDNFLGGVIPSAFVSDGMTYNDAIDKALGYTSLKAIAGVDYDVSGTVDFAGNIEQRITVNFSVNSAVYVGSFVVKLYNQNRSGFNNLLPRDLTGTISVDRFTRIQAVLLSVIFTQDIATLENGYLSVAWVNHIISVLTTAGVDTTGVRDLLVGTMVYKIYNDTYSDLVDLPYKDSVLTLRYQGSRVTPPFITHIELPVL